MANETLERERTQRASSLVDDERSQQQQGKKIRGPVTFVEDWEQIDVQGAYVEESTGDLFRIPEEALQRGYSPVISKISKDHRRLYRLGDAHMPIGKARLAAADQDIEPNF